MNDDPRQVDVLYMKVGQAGATIKSICNVLSTAMLEAGVLTQAQAQHQRLSAIKLHATLMNTKYRSKNDAPRETFDASQMLEKFGEYEFGSLAISHIALSSMQPAKKCNSPQDQNYYYQTVMRLDTSGS
eukprot:TRINITY_DN36276_c0_g2_i2.p1 TRINITY_DN36276_c0_g2~~TRINITY_DN36276_c0_g2_i2.p1  ORF type:complete len:129 (+),score=34.50 TRINITY_DN36276_c0_g2_i2:222-608(+)